MSDMKECINCPYVMTDKCSIWSENGISLCTRKVEESVSVSRFDHALFAERYKPKSEVSTEKIDEYKETER